jgi:hypothetical protein
MYTVALFCAKSQIQASEMWSNHHNLI